MIFTYILNESGYDRYNKNANDIYRLERTFINPETGMLSLELGSVAPPFAPLLKNDFKEIKKITRFLMSALLFFVMAIKDLTSRMYISLMKIFSMFLM
ncbi:MAG: hypothetical protein WKG06_35840 [Segetibacter sp.]